MRAGAGDHMPAVLARESYLLLTIAMMAVLFAAVAPRRSGSPRSPRWVRWPASAGTARAHDPQPVRAQEALVQ